MSSPQERGKRMAAKRQALARSVFSKQLTEHVDAETLLIDKLMQRTKGGSTGVLQQFRKLDSTIGDESNINFEKFRNCLEKFGLEGLPEDEARKLFRKYDPSGTGSITFKEFASHVANHFSKAVNIGDSSTDIQDAKRAREKARILKQQAMRTQWQTVSVNAEELLLQKIEQRLKGGAGALRLSFRKFYGGDQCEINFREFQKTIQNFGLEGVSENDARVLFAKFDDDGNGTIDFQEFAEFVMKSSSSHNSLRFQTDSADKESKRQRKKALEKQQKCNKFHWRYAQKHMDIEAMLVDKITQKLKGGPHGLRRAFCLFDTRDASEGNGTPEINYPSFKLGLESLGLTDIPDTMVRRLFRKYDTSGDGMIDFPEFIDQVAKNFNPLDKPKNTGGGPTCCKHCCCSMHHSGKRFKLRKDTARSVISSNSSTVSSLSSRSSASDWSRHSRSSRRSTTRSTGSLPMITGRSMEKHNQADR